MKATLYDVKGAKKSEIDLPEVFNTKVREDLAIKYFEIERFRAMQPYYLAPTAGRRHSASGTISHRRHEWKGHYGKGIARVPRKAMWRRGTQFYWIGAEVSGTRGGRRVHGPRPAAPRKLNKKEVIVAFNSALASTMLKHYILKRYSSLDKIESVPAVVEHLPSKTKDLIQFLKAVFGDLHYLTLKTKVVRSGKGKRRGRKYKSNAGILVLTGKDEKAKFSGLDVLPVDKVKITDLYPLGRLTIYTKKAIEELGAKHAA